MYNQNMKEKTPKEYWEQIEKDNEDIMTRMHPATIVPGFLVGIMVLVGCIFKIYMGW
jgi:hypothetical protein|tara:strand:- start:562 stop:732 length:171 start_codon:yes stop_codon:yes gene_type:complete